MEFFTTMKSGDSIPARRHFGLGWLGLLISLWGVYRVVVGDGSWPEWIAGFISAALATATAWATTAKIATIRITPAQLGSVLVRVPMHAVRDAVRINLALIAHLIRLQPISGQFRALSIRPGGDDPESIGRRVLIVVGGSIPANSVMVTIDRKREKLLVHELLPHRDGAFEDREWPI